MAGGCNNYPVNVHVYFIIYVSLSVWYFLKEFKRKHRQMLLVGEEMQKNLTLTPVIIVTCNLLVRMMLGYMAPTSRWYMMGFSSLLGQSLNMDRLSMMSAHTSSKFVTSSIGIFSSTSIACFIVLSTLSIRFWNASGTYMYVLINFNIFSTFSIPLFLWKSCLQKMFSAEFSLLQSI